MSMVNENNSGGSGGLNAATVVMIVFIILKVVEVEPVSSWSWMFVIFIPFIVAFAVAFGIIALVLGGAGLFAGVASASDAAGRRRMGKMMRRVHEEEAKEAKAEAHE